tara:strand:- start:541 stop:1008 length:468 start_codon:yes stop_codon:yes gene_type:complete
MATTHKVVWSVLATPKVIVDEVPGASLETVTLHEDIRKSLGGSGQLSHAGAIDYGGVTDGGTNYLQATSGGVTIGDGDTRFIWVKHTGYLWSSSSVLGAATTDKINIHADVEHVATLKAGEAWIIPLTDTSSNVSGFSAKRGGSVDIAVEAIGLD